MGCEMDSSSSSEEWSGEAIEMASKVKFPSGAKAHDKNELEQRY